MNVIAMYQKPQFIGKMGYDIKPTIDTISETHVVVKMLKVNDNALLNDVFYEMQAENWSPNGEAQALIRALDLEHTSMSVGDVILDVESGTYYVVLPVGFEELK